MRDERKHDGTFVRIMDCRYCGRYELPLDPRAIDRQLVRKLRRKGFDLGIKEEEISEFRKKELERLRRLDDSENKG